jgi:hypothetical protein
MNPDDFGSRVRAYCQATNASITSWGRTEKRNTMVGGHPHSKHLVWLGADCVPDEPVPVAIARKRAAALGLKLVREKSHDHLQPL